jgi:hypothetical protein
MRNTGKGARADQRKTEIEKETIRQTKVEGREARKHKGPELAEQAPPNFSQQCQ